MCGISGIIDLSSREDHFKLVERMNKLLYHRGPDSNGIWKNEEATLGHTRLSIIDLTKYGSQPMTSKNSRYVITYNGEIYNFIQLRKKLIAKGIKFEGKSDTEVLLKCFEIHGTRCLNYLEGMFAFAIWDKKKKILFIARDRIGEKPCYYNLSKKKFIFSSEIKGILCAPWIQKKICKQSISNLSLFSSNPGDKTIYENILSIPPAHYLIFKDGKISIRKYWQLKFIKRNITFSSAVDELDELMKKKISDVIVSDVPIGLTLSGGVDSSYIAAIMKKNKFSQFKSFCITSTNEVEKNRAEYVGKKLDLDHSSLDFNIFGEKISDIIFSYDEPVINGAVIYSHEMMRQIRNSVKVCLSGNGADEIFAGYDTYNNFEIPQLPYLNVLKNPFANRFTFLLKYFSLPYNQRRGFYFQKLANQYSTKFFTPSFKQQLDLEYGRKMIDKACLECDSRDFLDCHLYTDLMICHQHGHCKISDISSMHHSLEVRSPFLNHKIIEFASSIPNNFKVKKNIFSATRKSILKKSLQKFLPKSFVNRRKIGFGYDLNSLVSNFFDIQKNEKLKNLLLRGAYRAENIFNEKFINEICRGGSISEKMLVCNIAIWYERCVASKNLDF